MVERTSSRVRVRACSCSMTLITWKPYSVFTKSDTEPLGSVNATFSNSGNGLLFDDPAEIAALDLGRIVFGVFFREIFKVCAALGLFLDAFGLLLDFGDFGVGLAHSAEQNVFDVDAILDFVFVDVLVVVGLQISVGDRNGRRDLGWVEQGRSEQSAFPALGTGDICLV